ncbi:MAG: hypothetical protein HYY01_12770 [Chloroflexi bacterium]|nr:hypothetical protein [Chloroflexota bacterium]
MVGQIGGPTQAVAVQGDYAYVGVGLRLIVLDISNPANPREVGATEPFGWYVEDVAVVGNTAFVAAGGAGIYIVGISDPAHPAVIGSYDTPGYAESVVVAAEYAYVADGPAGLRVVDIGDLAHPAEVGDAYSMNYAFDVAVEGRYAFIAAAGAGLLVADISDPSRPREIGSLDTPGYAYGVAVSGSTVYVADGWGGLRVVDIADASRPREAGFADTPGWAFDIAVKDGVAYVADGWGGLRVLDVTKPAAPAEVGSHQPDGAFASSLAVSGNRIYVADREAGLRILDTSAPARPVQLAHYRPLGYAADVAAAGNYAYVAAGQYGLRVVDMSDPTRPREVGSETALGWAETIAVAGQHAYVGTFPYPNGGWDGLQVVNIADPAHPKLVSSLAIEPGVARDIVVRDGIAYIPDEWGLQLIDVSDPLTPVKLSFTDLHTGAPGQPPTVGIDVKGNMAFIAQETGGLLVVDVSDPRKPVRAATYKSPDMVKVVSLVVSGEYAYMGDHGRLQVVDISIPTQPKGLGFITVSGIIDGMALAGDSLYLAGGAPGVEAMDVSAPRTPVPTGHRYLPGATLEVAVAGNLVYAASQDGGLLILRKDWVPGMGGQKALSQTNGPRQTVAGASPAAHQPGIHRVAYDASLYGEAIRRQKQATDEGDAGTPVLVGYRGAATPTTDLQAEEALTASDGTWTVTSNADSGLGTLRWALENAGRGDTVIFDPVAFPPRSPAVIKLLSYLPPLGQGGLTIDASSAGVILDGSGAPPDASGLNIISDGNVVKGLQVLNFPGSGVFIGGNFASKDNVIGGDRTRGSGPLGEGNLISGNGGGVGISGSQATGNRVSGNYIGTDVTGTSAKGNRYNGVHINGGASHNVIGGTTSGERNVISGNEWGGIAILDKGTMDNRVLGNYIGLDASGTRTLGHLDNGVFIGNGASGNIIGGTTPAERNVISGNGREEVGLMGGANDNVIVGNYVGTDAAGSVNLGTSISAVTMELGPFNNVVQGNVISTSGGVGVMLSDWGTWGNEVIGNFIGVDVTGTRPLGGTRDGIHVNASFNRIGGTTPQERNIISGNGGNGIKVGWRSITDVVIIGNYIGTDATGTRALGNTWDGIRLTEGTHHSFIGGATEAEGNVISGNQSKGVRLQDTGVRYNFVAGNYIGVGADGTSILPNQSGVDIQGAEDNFVESNLIAYNKTGIALKPGEGNRIHHNSLIKNGANASDEGKSNRWDDGREGNDWSDYKGTDANGDGIGDTPYPVPPNGVDNHPLMEPPKIGVQ